MRISDWSSDVCVAILHLGPACESWTHQMSQAVERELLRQLLHISGLFGPGPHDAEIAAEHVQYLRELIKVSLPQHLANWGDARVVFEIGRASGRERVCQYVLIQVVAGS